MSSPPNQDEILKFTCYFYININAKVFEANIKARNTPCTMVTEGSTLYSHSYNDIH